MFKTREPEPGRITAATAAYDDAAGERPEPAAPAATAGPARLNACGETDDDADEIDSSKRACAGADAANRRRLAWFLVSDKSKRNECSKRASRSRAALPPRRRHTMMPSVRSLRRRPARQDIAAAISAGYGLGHGKAE